MSWHLETNGPLETKSSKSEMNFSGSASGYYSSATCFHQAFFFLCIYNLFLASKLKDRTANKRNHILNFDTFLFPFWKISTFPRSSADLCCSEKKKSLAHNSATQHMAMLVLHFHLQPIIRSPRWATPALVSALIRVPPSRHWLRIIAARSELNNRVGKQSLIQSNDAIRGTWHEAIPL